MADFTYPSFKSGILQGLFNLQTDNIFGMLVTSGYVPSAAHVHRSNVTNEVAGVGYVVGGQALTGKLVTIQNTGAIFSANALSWPSSTITARAVVVYKSLGAAASDLLISYIDFLSDQVTVNDTFQINWNALGIVALN